MTSTVSSALPSLSAQYADVIACTNALLPGTEGGENSHASLVQDYGLREGGVLGFVIMTVN